MYREPELSISTLATLLVLVHGPEPSRQLVFGYQHTATVLVEDVRQALYGGVVGVRPYESGLVGLTCSRILFQGLLVSCERGLVLLFLALVLSLEGHLTHPHRP